MTTAFFGNEGKMQQVVAAVIGCGNISGVYLKNMTSVFGVLRVKGVCDLIAERAQNAAAQYGIAVIYADEDEVLRDDDVQIVINLTQPAEHARLNKKILEAGKHLYTEKPLAIGREEGAKLKALAHRKGLLAAGAPDTFLGGGLQTARRAVEEGRIGKPLSAVAFMACHGHESWHPDPEYYYQPGAGPMMDMGPYYLTALLQLMGPMESIAGATARGFDRRTIQSPGKRGKMIDVGVDTHVAGVINFHSGAIASIMMSFDIWKAQLPHIEIYGTEGTLSVPDPDRFAGPVKIYRPGMEGFEDIPVEGFTENTRGIGVADLAYAIVNRRTPRAGIQQVYHVLDALHAFEDSCREGLVYRLRSTAQLPPLLPGDAKAWAKQGD